MELCCQGTRCCSQRGEVECFWQGGIAKALDPNSLVDQAGARLRMVGPGGEGLTRHAEKLGVYPDGAGQSLKRLVTWLNLHPLSSWGQCRVWL